MPPGFHLLIAAQFVSALADNALFIVSITRLQQQGLPAWWEPLLKFSFNHDEFARKHLGHNFGGIDVAEDYVHETADGFG